MPETENIPLMARRCWNQYRTATKENREAEEESLGFYVGGDKQWRQAEISNRKSNNRPYVSINRCKPAVDQVENQARANPPGPEAYPVGNGADKDGADILEGLVREYEYRSRAVDSYITGMRYALAGGSGCFKMSTDYRSGRSMEQCIVIEEIKDPAMVFTDPNAIARHRKDAMWMGEIRRLTEEQIKEQYPEAKISIFNRGLIDRAAGWMQDAIGLNNNDRTTFNEWVNEKEGLYFLCEFWRVLIKKKRLIVYDDGINRYEDEDPGDAKPEHDKTGEEMSRIDPVRTIRKYVVTALDELVKPVDWYGDLIPYFWQQGPEIYIKGKLHRLSLISGAMAPQRSLNYTATSMNEIVGLMTKSPFVGWEGQFDVSNAQGFNPWEDSNGKVWAYMEVKAKWAVNPVNKAEATLLPAPQRNQWEAPIARLFEALNFWGEQIKAATSIFFDPSIQSARDAQSGEAIKALQTQTNIGTANWQNELHSAVELSYNQAAKILPKITSGPRAVTIVRPDSQHETKLINQLFEAGKIDPKTGKPMKSNSIIGEYSLRVTADGSWKERNQEAIARILDFLKIAPEVVQAPGVAGQLLRMIGDGNPEVEQIADALTPGSGDEVNPQQMQTQLAQAAQEKQALTLLVQKLQMAIQAKLPQIEADKIMNALDNITKIHVAEVTASKDADNQKADREADLVEHLTGLAHEAALQAQEQEHERGMQQSQQVSDATSQASAQDHATESQQSDQEAAAAAPDNGPTA